MSDVICMSVINKLVAFASRLLDDNKAIGTAMIAGIVMIIVGGIVYMLGVFLVSTVSQAIPLITANSSLNTTQAQANVNIANAFNIVGIGLVVGGIIAILYEILPIATIFMGGGGRRY